MDYNELNKLTIFDNLIQNSLHDKLAFYLHLPFCPSRCLYCNCVAYPFQIELARTLLEIIPRHLEMLAALVGQRYINYLYFGGGTPSMWPVGALAALLQSIISFFPLTSTAEVSIEAHPATLGNRKLSLLRLLGFNRLSLGVQTFNFCQLNMLGRYYLPYDIYRIFSQARSAGFTNLNLDLIYGLPGQSAKQAEDDIQIALKLMPDHLSLYELMLDPCTSFGQSYVKGLSPLPSDNELMIWEKRALKLIAAADFRRYEISNFAQPGYECQYNQFIWQGGEYLALGPGAHSYFNGWRWSWVDDINKYIYFIKAKKNPFAFLEKLTSTQRAFELIILGLRTTKGVNLRQLKKLLGNNPFIFWEKSFFQVQKLGLAQIFGEWLIPTIRGLSLADLAASLFSFDIDFNVKAS